MDNKKLMDMLSGAKQVMDKVESGNYVNNSNQTLHETIGGQNPQLLESIPNGAEPIDNPTRQMGNSFKNLETSRMPDAIKRAMVSNPQPEMGGNGPTFSLEDVKGMVNPSFQPQNVPQPQPQPHQTSNNQAQVNESKIINSQGKLLITLTEAELDKKIQEALLSFMATTFTKTLTEGAIKKTISTLIKEGKIKVKPKMSK
tara:strand:+ start:3928 stop:4527 length:600 start_codon:yes stop_codon:yes gene_type:complete